ncbi:MAG: hypothetical protein HZB91_09055 [Elusimicrobia bacterium]|nr:hypothetical protein [Elusimicrobiota bacterium]
MSRAKIVPVAAAAVLAWLSLPSAAWAASLTSAGPGLVVDDRGSAAETRALKRVAASLARSRTAAGLLQELAIIGDAKIAFSSSAASVVDASAPFDPDRVAILGQLAWADFSEPRLRVFLDEKLLPYNPDRVAPILAHELLGHSLPLLKADKAGLGRRVFARFDSNEVYACLVDAAISLELRLNAYESQAASLMLSTASYMADIRFLGAGYALSLAREEAADPAKAYLSRLAEARTSLKGLPAERRRWKAREALLKHLVDEDGMSRQILKTARSEVRYRLDTYLPDRALPRKEWVDWTAVRAMAQEDLLRHDGLDPEAVRSAF